MRRVAILAVILIAGVMVASLVLLGPSQLRSNQLSSDSTKETTNSKVTSNSTTFSGSTGSSAETSINESSVTSQANQTLLAECSDSSNLSQPIRVVAGTISPAVICFQLYYFDLSAPKTLNMTDFLEFHAVQYPPGAVRVFDGTANFTVVASQGEVVLGGPTNQSEGVVVAFAVTAKPGASGTYQLDTRLQVQGEGETPPTPVRLGSDYPGQCGDYGVVVAGNGEPNYSGQDIHCTVWATSTTGWTVPGVPYKLDSGYLYFRIVAERDSPG